jgi:hypothetical protein
MTWNEVGGAGVLDRALAFAPSRLWKTLVKPPRKPDSP